MKVHNRKRSTRSTAPTPQERTAPSIDTQRLPIDARTGEPIAPRAQPGYYPGYSTLSQQAFWDEATRQLVLARVEQVSQIRFFLPEEAQLMQAVCDRLLPQDD